MSCSIICRRPKRLRLWDCYSRNNRLLRVYTNNPRRSHGRRNWKTWPHTTQTPYYYFVMAAHMFGGVRASFRTCYVCFFLCVVLYGQKPTLNLTNTRTQRVKDEMWWYIMQAVFRTRLKSSFRTWFECCMVITAVVRRLLVCSACSATKRIWKCKYTDIYAHREYV